MTDLDSSAVKIREKWPRMLKVALFGVLLLFLGLTLLAYAQKEDSYLLEWSTIDSGGQTSIGEMYSLHGTIGQFDTASLLDNEDGYLIQGGYWSNCQFGIIAAEVAGEEITFLHESGNYHIYMPLITLSSQQEC